jgi:hypothetical protein
MPCRSKRRAGARQTDEDAVRRQGRLQPAGRGLTSTPNTLRAIERELWRLIVRSGSGYCELSAQLVLGHIGSPRDVRLARTL